MAQRIVLPNGDNLDFPDGMADKEIETAIQSEYPEYAPKESLLSKVGSAAKSAASGIIDQTRKDIGFLRDPSVTKNDAAMEQSKEFEPSQSNTDSAFAAMGVDQNALSQSIAQHKDQLRQLNPGAEESDLDALAYKAAIAKPTQPKPYDTRHRAAALKVAGASDGEASVDARFNQQLQNKLDQTQYTPEQGKVTRRMDEVREGSYDKTSALDVAQASPGLALNAAKKGAVGAVETMASAQGLDEIVGVAHDYRKELEAENQAITPHVRPGSLAADWLSATQSVMTSGVTIVAAAATAWRNPALSARLANIGLTEMGVQKFGERSTELLDKGYSPSAAIVHGLAGAITEVGPEKLSLNKMLALFGKGAGERIAKGALYKKIAQSMAVELGTEELTTIADFALQKWSDKPDMTGEDLMNQIKSTAISTMMATPIMMGGGAVANKAAQLASGGLAERQLGRAMNDSVANTDFTQRGIDAGVIASMSPNPVQVPAGQIVPERGILTRAANVAASMGVLPQQQDNALLSDVQGLAYQEGEPHGATTEPGTGGLDTGSLPAGSDNAGGIHGDGLPVDSNAGVIADGVGQPGLAGPDAGSPGAGGPVGNGVREDAVDKPATLGSPDAPQNERTNSLGRDSSWVIKNKDTGEVIMETFDKAKVDALNTEKYEAVPILQHLQGLNTTAKPDPEAAPTISPASMDDTSANPPNTLTPLVAKLSQQKTNNPDLKIHFETAKKILAGEVAPRSLHAKQFANLAKKYRAAAEAAHKVAGRDNANAVADNLQGIADALNAQLQPVEQTAQAKPITTESDKAKRAELVKEAEGLGIKNAKFLRLDELPDAIKAKQDEAKDLSAEESHNEIVNRANKVLSENEIADIEDAVYKQHKDSSEREQHVAMANALSKAIAQSEVIKVAESSHKDVGEAVEPATPDVVKESVSKGDANSKLTFGQIKERLISEASKAIASVDETPTHVEYRALIDALSSPKRMVRNSVDGGRAPALRDEIGYTTFDVPGDGIFKVLNTLENLNAFMAKISALKAPVRVRQSAPSAKQLTSENIKNENAAVLKDKKSTPDDLAHAIQMAAIHGLDDAELVKRHAELMAEEDAKERGMDNKPSKEPRQSPTSNSLSMSEDNKPPNPQAEAITKMADAMATMADAVKRLVNPVADAKPLYAHRPVTNAEEIIAWAESQGFTSTLPAKDMHVTIAYSTSPMDGNKVSSSAKAISVDGGKRTVEPLGDGGAVVLKFSSDELQKRWQEYRDAGASWDYDGYTPHVTLTYKAEGIDLSKVAPYTGRIDLGKEAQEPLNEYKADEYVEQPTGNSTAQKPAQEAKSEEANDRDHFAIDRYNQESEKFESVSFERGEYIKVASIDAGVNDDNRYSFGEIEGISQANKEAKVNGVWYRFAQIYKAEKPESYAKPTVPLSSVVESANQKHGADLSYADRIHTLAVQQGLFKRIREGEVSADEFKASFDALLKNKAGIVAEMEAMTKPQIFKQFPGLEYRYKNEKKADGIKAAYRDMISDFTLGESYSYGMSSGSMVDSVRAIVDKATDESLSEFADGVKKRGEERAAARAESLAGMANPETLEDYQRIMAAKAREMGEGATYQEVRMSLPLEQRIRFDELAAEFNRGERARSKTVQQEQSLRAPGEAVGTTEIIQTKHTKHGHDLWQFAMEQRVSPEEFKSLVSQAKRLGGDYSSYRGNGAIPGWQFRTEEAARAFKALVAGDTTDAKEVMQTRRDAYADDRSQSAVERLTEMADKLEERADASLNQERKANTEKRARQAASAEAAASGDKAMAQTMRNIANGIQDGSAKMLDKVRQKVQVEMLQGFVNTAQSDMLRKLYPSYADQERHKGEKPTAETADHATFPAYTAYRSDLASLGRALLETEGTKKLGQRMMRVADDVSATYLKFAKDNVDKVAQFRTKDGSRPAFPSKSLAEESISRSGYKGTAIVLQVKRNENLVILSPSEAIKRGVWDGDNDKRITLSGDFGSELVEKIGKVARRGSKISVPWQFENAYDKRKRLAGMNIETPAELRAALREFIGLHEAPQEADKIKQMERAMIGRKNDGLDFFPTPASVADEMIEAADIQEGMSVLEPSAGWGHIAERIREAGFDPDVVELSNERKELLEAKGFRVVGRDFMDINPREFFTYGDTFKTKDGTEGIMHGSGGLGSNRVGLYDKDGLRKGWFDRDELIPVAKNGTESGYDRILMNPPFGDRRDAEHVQHAYEMLKPGGRLVAIMGEGVFFGNNKKAQAFRDWMEQVGATDEKLEAGSFMDPALPVNTSVSARMVVINKEGGKGAALFHRAWHGSPYDHDGFSMEHVGTGEGAAAYGHGLYFAGSREVAEWYKNKLSGGSNISTLRATKDGKDLSGYDLLEEYFKPGRQVKGYAGIDEVVSFSPQQYGDNYKPWSVVVKQVKDQRGNAPDRWDAAPRSHATQPDAKLVKEVLEADGWKVSKGRLYQIELAPTQDEYLDWDKPLSEQSEKVKAALEKANLEYPISDSTKGEDIYLNVALDTGNGFENTGYEAASGYLHSIGIRGIRYLDGSSRSAGEGNSNYVIFDDKDVSISEKFKRGNAQSGQPKAAVEAMTKKIMANWKNAPKLSVVQSVDDLPPNLRDQVYSAGAEGDMEGVYLTGSKQVYLVADHLPTPQRALFVLIHEAIGHHGLRGVFGDGIKPVMMQIYLTNASVRAKADELVKQYGYDKALATEEVLADMPGEGAIEKLNGWKRIVAYIMDKLRQWGVTDMWTDSDVIALLAKAGRHVIDGEGNLAMDGAQVALASRADTTTTSAAWKILSGDMAMFQNPTPDSFEMEQGAREIDPGMKAAEDKPDLDEEKSGIVRKWYVTMPDKTHAWIRENSKGEVWLDASDLAEGVSGGTKLYLLVGNYAEANGKVFIGDPAGLSDVALIRRTENMLSLALRFGTTKFLEPHRYQMNPEEKYGTVLADIARPITWVHGDDENNLSELLKTSYDNTINLVPDIKNVTYNFDKQRFEQDGSEFSDQDFDKLRKGIAGALRQRGLSKLVTTRDSRANPGAMEDWSPVGSATLKRTALTNTFSRAAGEGRGRDLLAEIGRILPRGLSNTPLEKILYSRQQQIPGITIPEETKSQAAQRVVQDKFNRFKVLQDWVKSQGMDLSEAADVYLAETLMSGRISTRKQDFRENQMGPLIQKTQSAGISMEQVGEFLKIQHAPEANKRAREIHHDQDATAYGVTDQDAADAMDEFKRLPNFAEIKAVSNEWRGITGQTKKILLDAGILSEEMAQAWDNTYSQYVPVKGMEDQPGNGTGKGLNVNGRQKKRLGHELRDEGIIENILRDHERAISLDEKNLVGKSLIRFALAAKNPDIITVSQPVKRQVLKEGQAHYMVTHHGADIAGFDNLNDARRHLADESLKVGGDKRDFDIAKTSDPVRVMLQASPMLADNEVNVYVAGHAIRVQINDEIAARAYTSLGVEHLNAVLSAGRAVNTWLSKAYTGYSPDFIFTNPIRDAIQGAITLTGNYGAGLAAKIFSNYPLAVKELAKHFRKPGSSSIVTDYRANGGSTGAAYLSDLERIGDDIQASYNEYAGMVNTYQRTYAKAIEEGKGVAKANSLAILKSGASGFKNIPVIGHFLSLMEHINALTENALRVATYHALVKEGVSKPRAAEQAKNLMNFNRKGEISNQAGALYLFFNPNVQGSQVIYRALVESEHKGQARALAGTMVLSAMALAALACGGGDDDKEKWNNTPDYVKDGNLVIGYGDYQITLPLPYGYRVFHTLGNVMFDYAQGIDGHKLGIRLASSVFSNFSPVGNPTEGEHGLFQIMPTIPKMILGPGVNEDSFGRAITPKRFNEAKPDSQMMNRTSKGTLYASTAEGLNALTGGTKYEKGAIDVSPETLKYWVKSVTGGAGQFAMDAIHIPTMAAQGVSPQSPRDIPIARRFVRETGISDSRSAFWDRANEAKKAADAFGEARKNRDSAAVNDILKENKPLIELSHYAENQQKMVKAKRDEIDRIKNDDNLSLLQKTNKMKLIENEESAIYTRFIRQFDKKIAATKAASK